MKKIGIVLFVSLIIFIGFLSWKEQNKGKTMESIKVSWYSKSKIESHDPANIQFAAPAVLLMNLYSSLLIYNNQSEIDYALVEKFNWIDRGEVEFVIRPNLLSSKGDPITAEDAYLSFKRLIVKQTNTHGDLQNFLCPGIKLKSIKDACPGLRYDGNSLFLRAADPNLAKFLLPLIANCDFGVIPKSAIDWSSEDLKIKDYSNTSGPYFVDSSSQNGEHILKANKNSPLYDANMPKQVEIVPVLDTSSPLKLKNREIDMITTIDRAQADDLVKFESESDYSIHKTSGLDVTAMQFTSEGRRKLTARDRLALGRLIKEEIIKSWPADTAFKQADQFFPPFGEAGLSSAQMADLKNAYQNAGEIPQKKIRISVEAVRLPWFKKQFSSYSNLEFIEFSGMPNLKKNDEMEDAFILPGDTGFLENISLISYYMSTGSFGFEDKTLANLWIQDYVKTDNKVERLSKLRQLHYDFLAKGVIVPISITPYFSVARKEWKLDFHKNFAGTPLWMMRRN